MAMQTASGGLSRLLLVVGTGYGATILVQNGKLSEILGDLASLIKGIENKGDQVDDHSDAIAAQVRRLAMEVRQLASSRNITVYNGESGGKFTSLLAPAAAVGALGYGYMWWKGISYKDLLWVTKQSMSVAVENLSKHLDTVSDALSKAKKHLTQRITDLDHKMDVQREISKNIKDSVEKTSLTLNHAGLQLGELQNLILGLDGRMDEMTIKQDYTAQGVEFLINLATGVPVQAPKPLQEQFKLGGNSCKLLTQGTTPMKGLKGLYDALNESIDDSVTAVLGQDGFDNLDTMRKPTIQRTISNRCPPRVL